VLKSSVPALLVTWSWHTGLFLQASLISEGKQQPNIGIHIASPGMVATGLLLEGERDARSRHFINILAEDAAVVANWLVPRIRGVSGTGAYFKCVFWPTSLLSLKEQLHAFLVDASESGKRAFSSLQPFA
jgi:chlorophyll(ide) b reductase